MFRERTVLLLGAGASAPYGYPLGDKLLANIAKGVQTLIDGNIHNVPFYSFVSEPYLALKQTIYRLRPDPFGSEFLNASVHDLKRDLDFNHRSIDEFVRTNPRWRPVIKIFVALEILAKTMEAESDSDGALRLRRSLSTRHPSSWYSELISELRHGAYNPHDLGANKLSIVTFNYDRSLEYAFERELKVGQIFSGFDMSLAPKVHHVHGEISFGPPPFFGISDFWQRLVEVADKFVMLDEGHDGLSFNDPMRLARTVLDWAEKIFILGFDLHDSNVQSLELQEFAQKCVVLNWEGSLRVRQRAENIGVMSRNIFHGTKDRPLDISSAIADGLFLHSI